MDIRQLQCVHCLATFKKAGALLSHQRQHAYCRDYFDELAKNFRKTHIIDNQDDFDSTNPDPPQVEPGMEVDESFVNLNTLFDAAVASLGQRALLAPLVCDATPQPPRLPTMLSAPLKSTTINTFPGAGHVICEEVPIYESWRRNHPNPSNNPYHPFKSKLKWDISRWAKQEGPGATSLDHLLKFDSVSNSLLSISGYNR